MQVRVRMNINAADGTPINLPIYKSLAFGISALYTGVAGALSAILVAFVASWAGTLALFQVEIWWELATLITIMLLGHWLEMRSIAAAQGALAALAALGR